MPWVASLLIAVDTNTRSPQTMGLETATPGTGVFHATFSPVVAFHFTAVGFPSAVPAALAPRKAGQFCAATDAVPRKTRKTGSRRFIAISRPCGCKSGWGARAGQWRSRDLAVLDSEGHRRAG